MKKICVVMMIAVLALMFTGCCKRVDLVTKVTTESFDNCLADTQDLLCDPTAEEKAEAASVLSFITSGIMVAGLVTGVPITVAQVQTIFAMFQAGSCVLVTDLRLAVQWYNALTTAMQDKVRVGKMTSPQMMPPTIPALQRLVK